MRTGSPWRALGSGCFLPPAQLNKVAPQGTRSNLQLESFGPWGEYTLLCFWLFFG